MEPGVRMKRFFIMAILSACSCLACQGCTRRALYETLQAQQRQECYRKANQNETQRCLDVTNKMPYDDYKRHREESIYQSK